MSEYDSNPNGPVPPSQWEAPVSDPEPQHQAQPQPSQAYPAPQSTKKAPSALKTFLVAFGGAALACILALGIYTAFFGGSSSSTVLGSSSSTEITASDEDATLPEQVASKCLPSVVSVYVYTNQSSSGYGMFGLSDYGSNSSTLTESSLGSGVVISEDGYILTNYHVVEGADALKVNIEGTEYDAEVVGYDASSDVAVVKADGASGLTAVEIGDSDSLNVGEWVMTIGSPYGYEQSVATGIVSATNRSTSYTSDTDGSTRYYTNMIQTDAAINSGNSGGALVDSDGKLIGINTLIVSSSGSSSGVGFAIPVNYAMSLAQQIIDGETPSHAQIGVSTTTVNSQIAQRYGLSVSSGAYITAVSSGSGADKAGLQKGDIVTKVDDTDITSATDFILAIRSHNSGDTIKVTYNRDGQESTVEATLGSDA